MKEKEQGTKVLNNFEPFNDIYYKDCFYHAFFPVVAHFNRSIFPFLVNDAFIYNYDKAKTGIKFSMDIVSKKSESKVLEDIGIVLNTKVASSNIISDLVTSINDEKPVIICIDCFYESIRPDAYQKNHYPHTLLIHGYNNIEETFNIIEHRYRDSYLYEKRSISYSDVLNSYNGLLNNLHKDKTWATYYEYGLLSEVDIEKEQHEYINDEYIETFINYISGKKEEIYRGMDNFKLLTEDFKQIVFDESLLNRNIDELLGIINNIIKNKSLERYHILKIFDSKPCFINLIDSIISNWSFIRGIVAKFKFSPVYNPKSFERSVDKLNEIYVLENRWLNSLFNFFREKRMR